MKTRAITGFVFALIMITGLLWNVYSFLGLFAIINAALLWEFGGLVYATDNNKVFRQIIMTALGCSFYALAVWGVMSTEPFAKLGLSVMAVFILLAITPITLLLELFLKAERPFEFAGQLLLGLFYLVFPMLLVVNLGVHQDYTETYTMNIGFTPQIILAVLLMVWANDVFAYIIGSQIGRTKLFERISPKKTWEGSIGGFILCLATGALMYKLMPMWGYNQLSLMNWIVLAGICSVFGTLGDLVESMLKRSLDIKDSGSILPGHGGFLDRFDAFIFAMPFVAFYLKVCL